METGALTGERGAYRLTRPIQAIEVPATVQVILAARIDRLPAEDKQLLQTASVIGKDVPFVLLHAVAEATEDAVQRGLAHLQAAEFLYETRLFPDPEYTFKHALTHEVTYGTLLQERRKALHARIVGAIERFYPDRLTEHVERLAHHAVRGEMWEKAVAYLRQAGAKALARSANREAVSVLRAGAGGPRSICPRPARRWSRPSIFASTFELRSFRSENSSGSSAISAKPRAWPGRSTINGDSGSCPSICATTSGSLGIRRKRSRSARAPRLLPSRSGMFRSR